MIIELTLNNSVLKKEFDIECDGEYTYTGKMGALSAYQNIELIQNDGVLLLGKRRLTSIENRIPFRYLFGKENLRSVMDIYEGDKIIGSFCKTQHGFMKSCCRIDLADKSQIYCYDLFRGKFAYVPIYIDDKQIALVEVYLTVRDGAYKLKMYLLDEFSHMRKILAMFLLYYAEQEYAKSASGSVASTTYGYDWRASRYMKKYDPLWREKHFPNENFWGKINRFE